MQNHVIIRTCRKNFWCLKPLVQVPLVVVLEQASLEQHRLGGDKLLQRLRTKLRGNKVGGYEERRGQDEQPRVGHERSEHHRGNWDGDAITVDPSTTYKQYQVEVLDNRDDGRRCIYIGSFFFSMIALKGGRAHAGHHLNNCFWRKPRKE